MTHATTKKLIGKGYVAKHVAVRWDMSPRTLTRRIAADDRLIVDAINGLPDADDTSQATLLDHGDDWSVTTGLPLGEERTITILNRDPEDVELNRADLVAMLEALL